MPGARFIGFLSIILLVSGTRTSVQLGEVRAQLAQQLRDTIKGRETEPAGQVFKNVQFMKDVPAAQFLVIMDGYTRGLGWACTHCHDEGDFASDAKQPKRAAREMQVMHQKINQELRKMANLQTPPEKRDISCSTCHRGRIEAMSGSR